MKSLNRILVIVIGAVMMALITYATYACFRIASAQQDAAMLRMHLESQQKQVQLLSAAVESADVELQRMRKEREKLAAIQSEYELRIAIINKQNAALSKAVSTIEHSTDESVQSWASAELPADAVGVLQHRANEGSSTDQNGNTAATRQHAINELPTTTL
ncbi:MAG TPA: hypothetical protein DCS87_11715 [Rheinheimera sp.]|nr:hypothetical protein [Rheinheimera sp.]